MSLWKMYNPYCIVYPELSIPRMHQSNRHSKRARGVLKHFNGADGAAGDGWLDLSFDVQQGKDAFQVCMDVSQFTPNELTVKVVDNSIVVEAKHEEREDDHGYISRHIVRRYSLPEGYEADKVVSSLSSDGVLTVRAPKPLAIESKERVVQIQQVGPAHLNVKHNEGNNDASEKPKENLPATKTA
ncbi:heat shock protein 23-like [Drosophila nasuta]|uniref:heat shock protein 23-like n=1 Tax=Drosophila nasuta TaxID=42062 RepID=UPI00295F1CE6|nr:heat shock protein 23-like [Drosophila nasuta]